MLSVGNLKENRSRTLNYSYVLKKNSLLQIVQTGSEVYPTSSPMGTGGSFPGGKAAGA
jgi:hypothetical protein